MHGALPEMIAGIMGLIVLHPHGRSYVHEHVVQIFQSFRQCRELWQPGWHYGSDSGDFVYSSL